MQLFRNKFCCSCGRTFEWKYLKLENGEFWFGKMEDKILNCVNFAETFNIYSFELRCPYCEKRHFVTIQK